MRLFERLPWCERIFGNGWDEGIRDASISVERLLARHGGSAIPRQK